MKTGNYHAASEGCLNFCIRLYVHCLLDRILSKVCVCLYMTQMIYGSIQERWKVCGRTWLCGYTKPVLVGPCCQQGEPAIWFLSLSLNNEVEGPLLVKSTLQLLSEGNLLFWTWPIFLRFFFLHPSFRLGRTNRVKTPHVGAGYNNHTTVATPAIIRS